MEYPKIDIKPLGVRVDKLVAQDLCDIIHNTIGNNAHCIIAHHNVHSVYLCQKDIKMRSFYDKADVTFIDGMPLVWIGQILGHPLKRDNRMTSLDWLQLVFLRAAQEGWRIFYLGSKYGVAQKGADILKAKYPGLQIDTHHGYFGVAHESGGNKRIIEKINEYRPHILFVGMGMPIQEQWVADNIKALRTNVIITIGAYIDYIAGEIPMPPRWMGRAGLEGLYRLCCEPQRLWRRYLVEPWLLLRLLGFNIERRRNDRKR
ncbi:MAG: WecB/TagA/CpsF family glycosyltransferase [Nitrospirae bacterium]|nr:WecB/TagA/CpsF family glycosyltransferase [Nitrospirota bacterium]